MPNDYQHARNARKQQAAPKDDGNRSHMEIELGPTVAPTPAAPEHKTPSTVDDKAIIPDSGLQRYYNSHNTTYQTT